MLELSKESLLSLALVFVLSGFIISPFILSFIFTLPAIKTAAFKVSDTPDNDEKLARWYRKNGGSRVEIRRNKDEISVRRRAKLYSRPLLPSGEELEQMGYRMTGEISFSSELVSQTRENGGAFLGNFLIGALLSVQLSFLLIFLWKRRKKRVLIIDRSVSAFSILVGVTAGISIIVLGNVYSSFLDFLGVELELTAQVWTAVKHFSLTEKLLVTCAAVAIAPICEELFFRKYIYGNFLSSGLPAYGLIFSSLIFAGLHFSFILMPVYVLIGIVLALSYKSTGSILTPILAHILNNGFSFFVIVFYQ